MSINPSSLTDMISKASIPAGTSVNGVSSLFKNPAASQFSDLSTLNTSLTAIPGVPDLGIADLHTTMSTDVGKCLADMHTDLPIMLSAKTQAENTAKIDAITTGTSSPATDTTVINNAFPTSTNCTSSGVGTAFAPITNAATTAGNAVSGILSSVGSALGKTFTSVSDLASHLGSLASADLAIAGTAIAGAASSITSHVTSALSTHSADKTASDAAKADALTKLKTAHTVSQINSTDPCVKKLMDATVDKSAIDPATLAVASNPSAYNVPVQTAVTKVQSGTPLGFDGTGQSAKPMGVATSGYTTAQLLAFQDKLLAIHDTIPPFEKVAAQKLTAIEQWKVSNNYVTTRDAAQATFANPYGTSTDQASLDAWKTVYDAYKAQKDDYNSYLDNPLNPAKAVYKAAYNEYQYRLAHGAPSGNVTALDS